MRKYLYIIAGSLAVILAIIGIFVPGLPTTPFLLLASWLFYNSSSKLHQMLNESFLGKYIRRYQTNQGVGWKTKLTSILFMSLMITISVGFLITNLKMKLLVVVLGLIGVGCILFVVPNEKKR